MQKDQNETTDSFETDEENVVKQQVTSNVSNTISAITNYNYSSWHYFIKTLKKIISFINGNILMKYIGEIKLKVIQNGEETIESKTLKIIIPIIKNFINKQFLLPNESSLILMLMFKLKKLNKSIETNWKCEQNKLIIRNLIYFLFSVCCMLLCKGKDPENKSKKKRHKKGYKYLNKVNEKYTDNVIMNVINLNKKVIQILLNKKIKCIDIESAGSFYINNSLLSFDTYRLIMFINVYHFYRSSNDIYWLTAYITDLVNRNNQLVYLHHLNNLHAQIIVQEYHWYKDNYHKRNMILNINDLSKSNWNVTKSDIRKSKHKQKIKIKDTDVNIVLFKDENKNDELRKLNISYFEFIADEKAIIFNPVAKFQQIQLKICKIDSKIQNIYNENTLQKMNIIMKLLHCGYPLLASKVVNFFFPNLDLMKYNDNDANKWNFQKWNECMEQLLKIKKTKKKCYNYKCDKKGRKICSGCFLNTYCSKHCQKILWSLHKPYCIKSSF